MPENSSVIVSNSGMRIEQIVDEGKTEKGKLVGATGHWEDCAALMWETDMKKLGLEPYQGDAEWNKLVDSKGNRLYGTQKSMIGGIWLRWKKPIQGQVEDTTTSAELKASLLESVSVAVRPLDKIWNHPAVADLFLDGLLKKDTFHVPPGLVSFTSTVIFACSILESIVDPSKTDGLAQEERSAYTKTARACHDLLTFLTAIPGDSTADMINASLASAEKLFRRGAAIAGVTPHIEGTAPILGGREESFVKLISIVTAKIKDLKEGDIVMVPAGWLRTGGDSQIMVSNIPTYTFLSISAHILHSQDARLSEYRYPGLSAPSRSDRTPAVLD